MYSCASATGKADDAVIHAMQLELSALKTLSEADENVLHSIICNCTEQKQKKNSKDAASVIASAAWGGAPVAPMPREFKPKPPPAKTALPPPLWQ